MANILPAGLVVLPTRPQHFEKIQQGQIRRIHGAQTVVGHKVLHYIRCPFCGTPKQLETAVANRANNGQEAEKKDRCICGATHNQHFSFVPVGHFDNLTKIDKLKSKLKGLDI